MSSCIPWPDVHTRIGDLTAAHQYFLQEIPGELNLSKANIATPTETEDHRKKYIFKTFFPLKSDNLTYALVAVSQKSSFQNPGAFPLFDFPQYALSFDNPLATWR